MILNIYNLQPSHPFHPYYPDNISQHGPRSMHKNIDEKLQ